MDVNIAVYEESLDDREQLGTLCTLWSTENENDTGPTSYSQREAASGSTDYREYLTTNEDR
jgi:hypothetical protein